MTSRSVFGQSLNVHSEFLFSNINVLMCYNRRQHTHLGKVTKEEHLESEFLFLSCMYLSNPTVPISIYEGKKKKKDERKHMHF